MSIHLLPHVFPSRPTLTGAESKVATPMSWIGNSGSSHRGTLQLDAGATHSPIWCNNLLALALAVALVAPLPSQAIPSLDFKSLARPSPTTPFSQAQKMAIGLENGKIRPCPSINPGCISSNPRSSNFAFPWRILGNSTNGAAIKQLQDALAKTLKNLNIQLVEDTPNGQYLRAEVDGGFGRDVLEFLINGDVVSFRAMATKVTYVYPFTTAFGDSKGQEERMQQIVRELGWYAPAFTSFDLEDK